MAEATEGQQAQVQGHESEPREPRGFGEHTRKSSSENAHEQGWGLNEEERRRLPDAKQDYEGGTDYQYGARDFGDTPVDTSAAQPSGKALRDTDEGSGEGQRGQGKNQRTSARRG